MARTRGARNAGYDERRLALARQVRPLLVSEGPAASLPRLAAAAGVSVATMRHYFVDQEGVLRAAMECVHRDSLPHLADAASPSSTEVRRSLLDYLRGLKEAWFKHGVGAIHASTLATGLSHGRLGPAYVTHLLEPLLETMEARLRRHVERGELPPLNERHAALEFLSPVVLGLLHQDSLSGASCRPLDVDEFFVAHVDHFLAAYRPSPQRAKTAAVRQRLKA